MSQPPEGTGGIELWPAPGSVWLRFNARGEVDTVWLTEERANAGPTDSDAPYTVERWAVHGSNGKPVGACLDQNREGCQSGVSAGAEHQANTALDVEPPCQPRSDETPRESSNDGASAAASGSSSTASHRTGDTPAEDTVCAPSAACAGTAGAE